MFNDILSIGIYDPADNADKVKDIEKPIAY